MVNDFKFRTTVDETSKPKIMINYKGVYLNFIKFSTDVPSPPVYYLHKL